MLSTMDRSSGSVSMSRMKDWSIFSVSGPQLLEVGERRVAGTEVVDREADTQRAAFLDHARHLGDVIERGGLQYFQFELVRR
jgi:hypothetical protein